MTARSRKLFEPTQTDESLCAHDSALQCVDFPQARRALLRWFQLYGRRFPWREDQTPYRVWVSEIMLQQTTTQTVCGYFEPFLTKFPDVATLARAPLDDVLKAWEGLGYYRRARALHQGAQLLLERYHGVFPSEYSQIIALPGVGRYCAGAILSFGFDLPYPILEANTTRLNARLTALQQLTTTANAQRTLWRCAEMWLPRDNARRASNLYRRLNAALTDLGSMLCVPNNPRCEQCPIERFCQARALGLQNDLPILPQKETPTQCDDLALWLTRGEFGAELSHVTTSDARRPCDSDVLLVHRRADALWPGLWDFPRWRVALQQRYDPVAIATDVALKDRVQFFMEEECGARGVEFYLNAPIKKFSHAVTRYRVTLWLAQLQREPYVPKSEGQAQFFFMPPVQQREGRNLAPVEPMASQAQELRWVALERLNDYPLSSTGRKIANFIRARRNASRL
ncbi:MAG: A/G-specific adenine glycosylase [Planctomycetia bacterium]|nr:A/G-specific adenine glycosylase [Planctomycetia bacterium]